MKMKVTVKAVSLPATPPSVTPPATPPVKAPAGSNSKSNITLVAGIVWWSCGSSCAQYWMCTSYKLDAVEEGVRTNDNTESPGASQGHQPIKSALVPGAQRYSYTETVAAINGFRDHIGSGGIGPVYYGRLSNGQEVAIKTLDANSHQGSQEFTNEVELLSRIHHRNLVRLLGFCDESKHQMLVYEYLHKGSVHDCLYGSKAAREPLDLKLRLDIALNAAQGLEYLHNGCDPNIIHRDIKSNNILLTDKYVAKVADFGLSKLCAFDKETHVVTAVKGTPGYLDPEYYVSNALTEKSDVFSFGVVLLEMLCARPPIVLDSPNPAHVNICNWARASLQTGNIDDILDLVIVRERPNMDVIWKVVELAVLCVEPKGAHRPSMRDVVRELQDAVSLNSNSTYDQLKPVGGAAGSWSAAFSRSEYSLSHDLNNS